MKSELVKIKSISTQLRGVSYKPSDVSYQLTVDHLPILRANNITERGIKLDDLVYVKKSRISEKQRLKKGDILIAASSGSKHIVGRAITIDNDLDAAFGAFCKVIRPDSKVIKEYIGFYFKSDGYRKIISNLSEGANINNIRNEDIDNLEIPLPPPHIQKYIAEVLDKADALLKKDLQLLQYYDVLAESLFIEMFGDPVKNEKGWEIKKLDDACEFLTSGSRGWAQYYSDSGDIFLRINNVGNNKLKLDDLIYVNAPNSAESKRTKVKSGDILFSITADIGRTAVIPNIFPTAFINQHLALIRLRSGYDSQFVSQVLSSDFGKFQLQKVIKGGVKSGLNFDDIRNLKFINPPISLQNQFAKQIKNIEQQKEKLKLQIQESENLFQALLQWAFNGSLN